MSRNIYICTVRNLKCVVTLATGVILLPSLTFTELYSIDYITPTCTWFLLQHLQTKLLSLQWNALQLAPTWPHLLRHSAKKDNKRVNSKKLVVHSTIDLNFKHVIHSLSDRLVTRPSTLWPCWGVSILVQQEVHLFFLISFLIHFIVLHFWPSSFILSL